VVWSLAFLLVGYLGTSLFVRELFRALISRFPGVVANALGASAIQAAGGILIFGLLTWAVGRRALGMSWEELGWVRGREAVTGFARGLGAGFAIGGLGMLLAVIAGHSTWTLDGGSFGSYLLRLPVMAAILLPGAFMEELALRGTPLVGMTAGLGRAWALLVTSVAFGLVHRLNPEVTVLALGNIALAGVFLGLTFFARGRLWTATGAHLGWNLALVALAAPVSGLPFDVPWLDFRPGRPEWLSGGGFGPEGGLVATVALMAGVAWVLRWREFREEQSG
jgi:membrane protease YdiL (CAAX protease family)